MVTVSAVWVVPVHALVRFGYPPPPVTAATLPALATAVAAVVVLAWLPPNGRYADRLRNGMRNAPAPQPTAAVSG
ncbi:hypothetical protein ABTY53_33800 [Streptomyces noursei]|uniref:hypothetical protein n=1 Tax=Streptomyces noursei TaxID=1971 RepID=UPI00331F8D87